ncbi:hypothetical protein PMIN06_008878 [Paraphaeosphaeria minitans]|uniref:Uncharacterized protein n=1 Tax=Paraphaeosphaeria minitans TaxID=565426 RepID=A0A9P6KTH6_9PLEO|nr:hypothetical protein PMIN01_03234 [Paraphaeosphaeria minitans]
MLVLLAPGDLTFRALRDNAAIDQENRDVGAAPNSQDNGSEHLHGLFIIVVVEGDEKKVDTCVADWLWGGIIVLLEGDSVLDIS